MKQTVTNRGYTGTIGGSLSDRPHKVARTSDELEALRGAGIVSPPAPTRNLRDIRHPRHASQSRAVTLLTDNGGRYIVNSRLEYNEHKSRKRRKRQAGFTKVRPAPVKPNRRYAGADHGESWQNKATGNVEGFKGTARKGGGDHIELA